MQKKWEQCVMATTGSSVAGDAAGAVDDADTATPAAAGGAMGPKLDRHMGHLVLWNSPSFSASSVSNALSWATSWVNPVFKAGIRRVIVFLPDSRRAVLLSMTCEDSAMILEQLSIKAELVRGVILRAGRRARERITLDGDEVLPPD